MRAPLRSVCTFKSLVAPPSPRATAKLDPRRRGEGPRRGAAGPPELQTGGDPARPLRRALPGRSSRPLPLVPLARLLGLGFLDLSAKKSATSSRTHPGQEERKEALSKPVDCGLSAWYPAPGPAHSRILWTPDGWIEGWVDGWKDGVAKAWAHTRRARGVGGGAAVTIIVAAAT